MDFVDNDRGRQRFDFRQYLTGQSLHLRVLHLIFHSFIHNIYRICMYIGSFRSHGSKIAGILRAIFRSESRNMHFLENDETMGDKGITHRVNISVTSCSSYRENKMIHLVDWNKNCSPIRDYYVLFSKNNQGHPDDKRCNKYTLFKDILDTANCLISYELLLIGLQGE